MVVVVNNWTYESLFITSTEERAKEILKDLYSNKIKPTKRELEIMEDFTEENFSIEELEIRD